MKQSRIVVDWKDDLDADVEADETIYYCVDGQWFEIDLSKEHAAAFHDALALYTESGRKTTASLANEGLRAKGVNAAKLDGQTYGPTGSAAQLNNMIREWARETDRPLGTSNNASPTSHLYIPARTRAEFFAEHPHLRSQ